MTRVGAGPAVLKPGDQVSVDVWIAKDGSLTASGQALKLSDGRPAPDGFRLEAPVEPLFPEPGSPSPVQ